MMSTRNYTLMLYFETVRSRTSEEAGGYVQTVLLALLPLAGVEEQAGVEEAHEEQVEHAVER